MLPTRVILEVLTWLTIKTRLTDLSRKKTMSTFWITYINSKSKNSQRCQLLVSLAQDDIETKVPDDYNTDVGYTVAEKPMPSCSKAVL